MNNLEIFLKNRRKIIERLKKEKVVSFKFARNINDKDGYFTARFGPGVSVTESLKRHKELLRFYRSLGLECEPVLEGIMFPICDCRNLKGVLIAYNIVKEFKKYFSLFGVVDEELTGRKMGMLPEEEKEKVLRQLKYENVSYSKYSIIVDGYESNNPPIIIEIAVKDLFLNGSDKDVQKFIDVIDHAVPAAKNKQNREAKELSALIKKKILDRKIFIPKVTAQPKDSRLMSHYYGQPYFEKGEQWPLDSKTKRPLDFIFQLVKDKNDDWPFQVVQFYYNQEDLAFNSKSSGWLVKTYAKINKQKMVKPRDFYHEQDRLFALIKQKSDKSLPVWGGLSTFQEQDKDWRTVSKLCEKVNELAPEDAYQEIFSKYIKDVDSWSFFSGYPRYVQGTTPIKKGYDFFCQIGCVPELDLCWGDCGAVYLFYNAQKNKFDFFLEDN